MYSHQKNVKPVIKKENKMELGAFSVSLNVKDIAISKAFYEKLGFKEFGGDISQNWLIMKNGPHIIGLFQGMFEKNCLTFNPGWNQDAQNTADFTDVRSLHKQLEDSGIKIDYKNLENASGPGSFALTDPDGNPILIDQHR